MDPSEVLIFRDYTGWEEPALSTPFGFWSLRNLAVLAIFGIMSGALYGAIIPDNLSMERDWQLVCIALTPLATGLILASVNTPFGSSDALIVSLIIVGMSGIGRGNRGGGNANKSPKQQRRRRKKSEVLGLPRYLEGRNKQHDSAVPLEITCADFDELKSIRVTIYGGDGLAYGSRLVKCYADDELIEIVRTTADGSLVLHIRPERAGSRILTVRGESDSDDSDNVLLYKPLYFVRGGGRGVGGEGRRRGTAATISTSRGAAQ